MTDKDWILVIASVFGGGLAGAVLTQIVQSALTLYWRPRLHLVFDRNVPGCEVETPLLYGNEPTQRYLRLKVLNTGRSPAEKVQVSIIQISLTPLDGAALQYRHEVLDLSPALTDQPFRIPREGHRFVDLFWTQINDDAPTFGFGLIRTPATLITFGLGPGSFSAEVFVSANGARSRRAIVNWTWDGTFHGLRAVGITWMF